MSFSNNVYETNVRRNNAEKKKKVFAKMLAQ